MTKSVVQNANMTPILKAIFLKINVHYLIRSFVHASMPQVVDELVSSYDYIANKFDERKHLSLV